MKKVKIIGAGSIGNHLAHASRSLGWSVDLCDIDPAALERARTSIYPERYGQWDSEIQLFHCDEAPKGGYDLIVIGTPPDCHMDLACDALAEKPAAMLVEKPLCGPDLRRAQELIDRADANGVTVFSGYDHVVGGASQIISEAIGASNTAPVTIDVEFREHWQGIFNAHPWLSGPQDTYLGYWQRGGGASGEHSHALNLWQHFAAAAGMGRIVEVSAAMDMIRDGGVEYDRLCMMHVVTEKGLVGRVVQDVVTSPPRKWARIQMPDGYLAWHCGFEPGVDAVERGDHDGKVDVTRISKTRPDDFIQELEHIRDHLETGADSPISLARGMDTMLVVAAAHMSVQNRRAVRIDYGCGYQAEALSLA